MSNNNSPRKQPIKDGAEADDEKSAPKERRSIFNLSHSAWNWNKDVECFVRTQIYDKINQHDYTMVNDNIRTVLAVAPSYALTKEGQALCTIHFLLQFHATSPDIVRLLSNLVKHNLGTPRSPEHEKT